MTDFGGPNSWSFSGEFGGECLTSLFVASENEDGEASRKRQAEEAE